MKTLPMKQFHVETKNQQTGEWSLAHRIKCHYRLGYVSKAWAWPLSTSEWTRLVIVEQEQSEMLALGRAMQHATFLSRRRRVAGTPLLASIETRIMRLELHPSGSEPSRTIVWESSHSNQKARGNGQHPS